MSDDDRSAWRTYWIAWSSLAFVHILIVWLLPVLPGQDLPQHLAYARIFRDYHDRNLPFAEFYTLPARFQPYFSVYWLLAHIGRWMTISAAMRVVMSAYVLALLGTFHALVRAVHDDVETRPPPWTALLGGGLVWNPIVCMGFVPFIVCIPIFLGACALYLRWIRGHAPSWVALATLLLCAAMASVHIVAAGSFLLFVSLHLWRADRRTVAATALVWTTIATVLWLWHLRGDVGLGQSEKIDFGEAYRSTFTLDFITEALKIQWYSPLATITYSLWAILGPYRWARLFVTALAVVVLAWATRDGAPDARPPRRTTRIFVAFAALAALAPWGLYVPTEITFLNFRLLALAFMLCLALVPPRRFASRPSRNTLFVFVLFVTIQFVTAVTSFAHESRSVLTLLRDARPRGTILTLTFHSSSERFGRIFRMSHFLPMYYTIDDGGIVSQFWADYVPHLPIGYRTGKKPAQPPDWEPWNFRAEHLGDAAFVLIQAPNDDDGRRAQAGYANAQTILNNSADLVRCDGLWCLYRVRRDQPQASNAAVEWIPAAAIAQVAGRSSGPPTSRSVAP